MADIFNMTDTWNDGGTNFNAIKMNVTDTASGSGSNLIDLQVGGSSKFAVSKNGKITVATPNDSSAIISNSGYGIGYFSGITIGSIISPAMYLTNTKAQLASVYELCWASSGWSATPDVRLFRDAANELALRNGLNAQSFSVYGTYTSSTVFERLRSYYDGTRFMIGSEVGSGGGTKRAVRLFSGDPAAFDYIEVNTSTIVLRRGGQTLQFENGALHPSGDFGLGRDGSSGFTHVTLKEKSIDPANPSEGFCTLWMSDGTGTGDDGDILMKITAGGVTKTATIVDFSSI